MNEAKTKLDLGDFEGAQKAALEMVKAKPTDITARIFLFELSLFSGDWERAERQLDVIGQQDMNAMIGSQMFKENLEAERARIKLFSEAKIPECLMQPPNYVEGLLAAIEDITKENFGSAKEIIDQVEEKRPAFVCKINGKESGDFRDFNDPTMCVFEAIIKGSYSWIPFEQVEKVNFEPIKSLRDNFWRQAEVTLVNGTQGEMFLPAIYVESFKSTEGAIRMGKATEWRDAGELYIGEGMRIYQIEDGHIPIIEIETIEFTHESEN